MSDGKQTVPKPLVEYGDEEWTDDSQEEVHKPLMSAEEQAEYDRDYQRYLERRRKD